MERLMRQRGESDPLDNPFQQGRISPGRIGLLDLGNVRARIGSKSLADLLERLPLTGSRDVNGVLQTNMIQVCHDGMGENDKRPVRAGGRIVSRRSERKVESTGRHLA